MHTLIDNTQQNCQIGWHIPNRVLQVSIVGVYTPQNATHVNAKLLEVLNKVEQPLMLLMDCSAMLRPANFETIRHEQAFMHHPMLSQIYVASNDRLVRFSMMVIFNASSAAFRVFDSIGQARIMIEALIGKR